MSRGWPGAYQERAEDQAEAPVEQGDQEADGDGKRNRATRGSRQPGEPGDEPTDGTGGGHGSKAGRMGLDRDLVGIESAALFLELTLQKIFASLPFGESARKR